MTFTTERPLTSSHTPTNARVTSAQTAVQLNRVSKVYANGSSALVDVSLQIRKGGFYLITGPSGSGKSTFLKLLYGEQRPTQGEIMVNGSNLSDLKGDRLAQLRRQIGVVFQDYKLIPQRTVIENVAFVLWAQGYTRKEIERRLAPTLKMVGLQDKGQYFPEQLSGGEQQRVSIARAIVATPPLLLADEPTGNLDPENSLQILNILKKLNSIGVTVIMTTHDQQLIQAANCSVLRLQNGLLVR